MSANNKTCAGVGNGSKKLLAQRCVVSSKTIAEKGKTTPARSKNTPGFPGGLPFGFSFEFPPEIGFTFGFASVSALAFLPVELPEFPPALFPLEPESLFTTAVPALLEPEELAELEEPEELDELDELDEPEELDELDELDAPDAPEVLDAPDPPFPVFAPEPPPDLEPALPSGYSEVQTMRRSPRITNPWASRRQPTFNVGDYLVFFDQIWRQTCSLSVLSYAI